MKFVKLLSTIALSFSFFGAAAQQSYSITAKITDTKHQPLPVTARILSAKDSSMISGSIFDDGSVYVTQILQPKILLQLSIISFKDTILVIDNKGLPLIDLGVIIMKEQNQQLDEVRITGHPPLVSHGKNGSIEIQVPGTLLAGSSTVMELLERSPGLSVADGRITFIGKGEAILFLNGRPITTEQLSAIAVNQILKVEILANPSSKYDAEGKAVINIITKINIEQGLSVSATQQYSYTDFAGGESNTLLDANYMKNKVSLAGNFGFLSGKSREVLYTTRTRPASNDYLRSELTTDWKRKFDNANLGLGLQYDINDHSNFSLSYKGNFDDLGGSQASKNALKTRSENSLYKSIIDKNEDRKNHSLSLNYNNTLDTAGSNIFVGSQFTHYQTSTNDLIHEDNFVGDNNVMKLIKNEVAQNITISSSQADYTKVFKVDRKLEAGIKFSHAENVSQTDFMTSDLKNDFQPDTSLSSKFRYTELLPAAYVNYNATIAKSISFTIGVRGEWTHYRLNTSAGNGQVNESSYLNLFPNLLLSKTISEHLKIRASFVSKISRPRYQALNPFVIYQDPFTTIEGNPNLKPEKIQAFELGANYGVLDFRAGFNYTLDPISGAALRGSKPNSYVLKAINLQKDYTWLASVSNSFNLNWWNSTNTATLTYSKSVDNQYDFAFVKPKPQIYLYSSNTFNVHNLFKIQMLAWYLGDRYYGLYYNRSRATVTLGVEKSFLKNTLTVRFTANDIFHQTNTAGTYSVGQTDILFDRTFSTNYFRLAATLRLGRLTKARFNNKVSGESENSRARN